MAAFPPVDNKQPESRGSRTLGEAVARLEQETDKLLDEIKGELPFHDTIRDVVDRMR
jgi:hypothetical protein